MLGFSLSEHINGISHLLFFFSVTILFFFTMFLVLFDSVDFNHVVMSWEEFYHTTS